MLNTAPFAIAYICDHDEEFGALVKKTSIIRATYLMLTWGGFNLPLLHKTGQLRLVLDALVD